MAVGEKQKQDLLVITSDDDRHYSSMIIQLIVLTFVVYNIAMSNLIKNTQPTLLSLLQAVLCISIFVISLITFLNTTIAWEIEIQKNPAKCIVKERKLLRTDTRVIENFTGFGYVKNYFVAKRITDTAFLTFIDRDERLIFTVEITGYSVKGLIEKIADYLEYPAYHNIREYEIYPIEYGCEEPETLFMRNIISLVCLLAAVDPTEKGVLLSALLIATWLFLKDIMINFGKTEK